MAAMSERTFYPAGVPCWVDTLQPDPERAIRFYGELFGWRFSDPGGMPGTPPGKFVARLRDRDVAGIGSMPAQDPTPPVAWNTHVSVANVDTTCAAVPNAGGRVIVPPFGVPPAGRIAVVADPAGARVCLWEARQRAGAQLVNEPSAWAMSALLTPDTRSAQRFYASIFGWETERFDTGEAAITLWRRPGYEGGEPAQPVARDVVGVMIDTHAQPSLKGVPPHWSVDFWTDRLDAIAAKVPALGGRIVEPPHETPSFRSATIADPHGALFSLSQLIRNT
jgi:predicted enzyme related to lactoylglutathione lyase